MVLVDIRQYNNHITPLTAYRVTVIHDISLNYIQESNKTNLESNKIIYLFIYLLN